LGDEPLGEERLDGGSQALMTLLFPALEALDGGPRSSGHACKYQYV